MTTPRATQEASVKASVKTSVKILRAVGENPNVTIPELAKIAGVTTRSVERNIKKLQETGSLKRVGPDKGGHWEVVEK
jgi:ATP-dependent DNA helicase RecG